MSGNLWVESEVSLQQIGAERIWWLTNQYGEGSRCKSLRMLTWKCTDLRALSVYFVRNMPCRQSVADSQTTLADMASFPKDQVVERVSTWKGRYVLYIDLLGDQTGVTKMLQELNLKPIVVHTIDEVKSLVQRPDVPKFDVMIVDSMRAVSKLIHQS
jgi:hypothetical protein